LKEIAYASQPVKEIGESVLLSGSRCTGGPDISLMVSTDRHAMSTSSSKAFGCEAKKAEH